MSIEMYVEGWNNAGVVWVAVPDFVASYAEEDREQGSSMPAYEKRVVDDYGDVQWIESTEERTYNAPFLRRWIKSFEQALGAEIDTTNGYFCKVFPDAFDTLEQWCTKIQPDAANNILDLVATARATNAPYMYICG